MTSMSGHHTIARVAMFALKYSLYLLEAVLVIGIILFLIGAVFGVIYIPRSNLHGF